MRLKIVDPGPEREAYLPLLLLADDSEQQVRGYMQEGILFVAEDDGPAAGIVLAIPTGIGRDRTQGGRGRSCQSQPGDRQANAGAGAFGARRARIFAGGVGHREFGNRTDRVLPESGVPALEDRAGFFLAGAGISGRAGGKRNSIAGHDLVRSHNLSGCRRLFQGDSHVVTMEQDALPSQTFPGAMSHGTFDVM